METHLRTTGCRLPFMGLHNFTCHSTQANSPRLNPSQ